MNSEQKKPGGYKNAGGGFLGGGPSNFFMNIM
jgi:hypothetical protein